MKKLCKRLLTLGIVLTLLTALVACASPTETTTMGTTTAEQPTETTGDTLTVRIGALKGPTGMGLVGLMDSADKGETLLDYEVQITGSPDDMVAMISSGQVDIAAVPTNLASILYNKTGGQIQVLALNTLGVLYILENGNEVESVADLAGKTIVTSGQGAVPEYVLDKILADSGLETPATVDYKAEHSEVSALAASGQADIVMLPEPFVTTVLSKNPDMRLALDLTAEWDALEAAAGGDSQLAMGCLVVNTEFAMAHMGEILFFLDDYKASVDFVNANPDQAGDLIEQYEILPSAALATAAIPNSHIVMIDGMEMIQTMTAFLNVLFEANPASVGGEVPGEALFFMP